MGFNSEFKELISQCQHAETTHIPLISVKLRFVV